MNHFTTVLSLTCIASLLAIAETYRDYSSPYVDPCGASATQAHDGDIAYNPIPNSASRQKRGATAIRERLWPNARIPYKISPTFNSYERSLLYEAMRQWEARTCVRFYERPSTHNQSYAYYFKGGCCASYVGRQSVSYQQGISLGSGCTTISKYLHEIGHVIGFWHEQSRPDRDEYIRILTENMNSGAQSNFRIQEGIDSMGVGYDYNSIMHYSSTTFGSGRTTLVAHDPSIPVGGAVELSELDILQANLLYQCDSENPPPSELPPPVASYLDQTLPDLPDCHMDFNNDYEGVVNSDNYPSTYSPNQNCAYRIRVPEGTKLNVTIVDLHLDWARPCNDSVTIYRTLDGSGEPRLHPRCGTGENMNVEMDGNVAYIKFVSDATNRWEGQRGFLATFSAEDINECLHDNGGCSQTCVNHVPGYECLCGDGWYLSGDMKICFDMNECALGNGGCQYKCRNTGGSFYCECPEGSTLNADGRTCSNPATSCAFENGGCDHMCSEGSSGVSCSCNIGYRLQSDGTTCRDIDECLEHNTCSYGGCRNTDGSYECTCESGYEMDPESNRCINVDECERGLALCQGEAQCRDTDGAYECVCGEGLRVSEDGLSCDDINECQSGSVCSHGCVNTHGSYRCVCPPGYTLSTESEDTCVDIDECLEGGCSQIQGATCQNTAGSFVCQCSPGYRLSSDLSTCQDINECSERKHNCQSGCSNTDGSFVCTCPDGYMLTSDGRTCKCGGVFTDASGSFSTPYWPVRYPNENFECEWMVSLPNPEATILFTIDDTAYGINGRSPCPTDYVQFFDGMGNDAASMDKLCKFDRASDPLVTSTSEGKVIFMGSRQSTRPISRVGVMVHYTTVMPTTAPPPTTTVPTTNPPTTTGSTNPPTTTGFTNPPTTTGSTNPPTTTGSTNPPTTVPTTNPPTTTATTNPPTTEAARSCSVDNGGCDHVCSQEGTLGVSCHCREGFRLDSDQTTCTDIDECSERRHNCQSGCSNTDGSFVCTCPDGYMLTSDGRTCKCGGVFTDASGSFSTPYWPVRYPNENFECEWMVSLPNPEATILFTIDDTAYGINGRSPCPTDYVQFFDGMGNDAASMDKLCKFDRASDPLVTSTSEGKVIFMGSRQSTRPISRVGVMVHYTTVMPTTAPPPTTTVPTTNPPTTTGSTNPPTTTGFTNPPTTTGSTNPPTTTGSTNPPTTVPTTNPPTTTATTNPPTTEAARSCSVDNGGCDHVCSQEGTLGVSCHCREGFRLDSDQTTCTDIDECSERRHNCQSGCSNTDGSFVCTCPDGYMLTSDGRTCKCGGVFTDASGSFSTPYWPVRYPNENFECEWMVSLPNPEATILFTIDDTAYGINGRSPCPTDYVQFFDGMGNDAASMDKLCKFDRASDPLVTSTSEGKVIFMGSRQSTRPISRVGVMVHYTTVMPTTAPPPTTTVPTTNPPTTTGSTNPPTTNPTTEAITTPPPVNECLNKNGGCQHECIDTPTSHYCSCRPGYSLDSDHRTCNIDCGGELTGPSGSFQTPDWPERYPQANFRCVWRITRPDSSRLIRFTVDGNHFGINGRNPCTDYLQFFRGSSQSNPVGDKLCFLRPPTDSIEITSTEATIVFSGSSKKRPVSRVGVKVYYEIV